MARILENHEGRRMIRLTPDDVLTVVSLYQQQFYGQRPSDYDELKTRLAACNYYLPEDT